MTGATICCPQCGALVPDVSGPVHKYVPSAPGCWGTFGRVQADESLRFGYPPAHRVVVDAYMAQHPDRHIGASLAAALALFGGWNDVPSRPTIESVLIVAFAKGSLCDE